MDMARVWPIVVQYGIGSILLAVGIWSGISSGYLDMKNPRDKRLVYILVGGLLLLVVLKSVFTFWLPYVPQKGGA